MKPALSQIVRFRNTVDRGLRDWMGSRDILEVHPPTLVPNPGLEPHLDGIAALRRHSDWGQLYLHTSPEYAIKAGLGAFGGDVFAMARCYRDEPPSRWHHPEFTMLEWYRHGTWDQLMTDCESLLGHVCALLERAYGPPLRSDLRVDSGWERRGWHDLLHQVTGVDRGMSEPEQRERLRQCGLDVDPGWSLDDLLSLAYVERMEPAVCRNGRPAFVERFPADQAALAQLCSDDPGVAERFEWYLPLPEGEDARGNLEVGNAFGELLDATEQRRRFAQDATARAARGADVYPAPLAMLSGLEQLTGPVSGIAVGVERVLCWLALRQLGWRTGVADWIPGAPQTWRSEEP
jgi:lysyl-tRNA synthetase class 2